jgi:hypothetical protein
MWYRYIEIRRIKELRRRKAVRHSYLTTLDRHFQKWKQAHHVKQQFVVYTAFKCWKVCHMVQCILVTPDQMYHVKQQQEKRKIQTAIQHHKTKQSWKHFSAWRSFLLLQKTKKAKTILALQHAAIILKFRVWKVVLYNELK